MLLSAILVVGMYFYSLQTGLDRLAQTGRVRIDQSSDRLLGQLSSFKQLPNILARHPIVSQAFDQTTDIETVNGFLANTALLSGAREIFIVDPNGEIIAQSHKDATLGLDVANQPYLRAALNGRLGIFATLDADTGARTIFIARASITKPNILKGIVVVSVDIAALEFEWHVDEEALAFFDINDVAFITNRSNLALRRMSEVDKPLKDDRSYTISQLRPFFGHSEGNQFGHALWRFAVNKELPPEALVKSKFIPRLDMTARVFLPTQAAKTAASLQAALVAAILFALGVVLWALMQRRKNLIEQLAIEEAANTSLEARVEKRTQQLKKAQYQLVQAGKLTALGEMSAGISHELNQPLAAMQNYAENGAKLLDRDRIEEAKENFGLINVQINRATRIISSLRAFARREKETIGPVDLQEVIKDSLNLAQSRIKAASVDVQCRTGMASIMVKGGHVRLQQVIINLLTNALDAVEDGSEKRIFIDLTHDSTTSALTIRDTGQGLEDPARVFDPFYSTKDIGSSKGMGLGLSISYGIVGSFGGEMTCRNHPDGGAEFKVELQMATP